LNGENSRAKVQNVREDSFAGRAATLDRASNQMPGAPAASSSSSRRVISASEWRLAFGPACRSIVTALTDRRKLIQFLAGRVRRIMR
jgi:hypothetical protein